MKKILKPGSTEFKKTCPYCGCEFTYEEEDLHPFMGSYTVSCPTCNHELCHRMKSSLDIMFG